MRATGYSVTVVQVDLSVIITGIYMAVGVLLLVVLYHLLFIVVYIKKSLRRVDTVTEKVEEVVLKPLAMADLLVEAMGHWLQEFHKKKHGKEKHHGKSEAVEVE